MATVNDEQCRDEADGNRVEMESQEIGKLVDVGLHAENIDSLSEQFFGDAFGHGLVRLGARVQVIARVKTAAESFRVVVAAYCLVEVYAAVEIGCGAEPLIECHADDVAVFVVGAPAVNRQQRAAVDFETELARVRDVERADAVDEVVGRGHVAPRAELVDFHADRVNDVVDAVLHDDSACACHVHFDREARGALQAVCRIRDAAVFAENARAAHRATDNRNVVEALACATQREVVGPVLRRNGIAKTDECEILLFGEDVDRIEEVYPVRFAREIVGECRGFCEVAVAVLAARKRARDCRACVHLRKVGEVEAHVECFACGHVECNFITQDFFARGDCGGCAAAEGDGGRNIFSNIRLANRHGLGAGEVRKMETQLVP